MLTLFKTNIRGSLFKGNQDNFADGLLGVTVDMKQNIEEATTLNTVFKNLAAAVGMQSTEQAVY